MMWRRVDPVHSFLPLVSIATFWCVVYGQSNTDGPSNISPDECIGRPCARYWWTSMWGFVVTLVALTMDVWGATKSFTKSTIIKVGLTIISSALNPLYILWNMLDNTVDVMAMVPNLREALGDVFIAPLYPWSKSHIKIILGCRVIVNLSPNGHKKIHNLNAFGEVSAEDLSEALVIGTKKANSERFNAELLVQGHLALLRSNVLPPYDELKFLRDNSSLGMAIASAQAIGYIYGVVVRCVQGLRVSPIEAIACILNMVILMKGFFHNFASIGHRPLLLYLLPEDEAKFIEECKNIQRFEFNTKSRFKFIVSIISRGFLVMGVYFIVNFSKSLNRVCVIPIVLFDVSLVLGGLLGFVLSEYKFNLSMSLVILVSFFNLVGYVWALVVSFKYWKGEEFDVQSSNYLSQVLPYIG